MKRNVIDITRLIIKYEGGINGQVSVGPVTQYIIVRVGVCKQTQKAIVLHWRKGKRSLLNSMCPVCFHWILPRNTSLYPNNVSCPSRGSLCARHNAAFYKELCVCEVSRRTSHQSVALSPSHLKKKCSIRIDLLKSLGNSM